MSSRYLSLVRCSTLGLLAVFALTSLSLAACGGDDTTPSKPVTRIDSGEPDSGAIVKRDAGQMSSKPDSGKEPVDSGNPFQKDAGQDSGSGRADAGDAGGGGDIDTRPPPVPDSWKCAKALWADGICDCGCGSTDSDCVGQSCTEPGCTAPKCESCYTTTLAWKSCEAAPDPSAWSCPGDPFTDDGLCDCGCTVPDSVCRGSGCTEPGCWRSACNVRHSADGTALPGSPPTEWTCPSAAWGGGNGCDCGCGAPDPDCQSQHFCTTPKCNDTECNICHDATGRTVPCSDALSSWTCDPQRFGSNDGCDCGCGAPDPDCADKGCTDQGCSDNACKRCTSINLSSDHLVGCAPAQWTCDPSHFGTGDGCDCGCGAADPDCGANNGCTDVGCQNDKCDYCHKGSTDAFSDYQICNGWTCGAADGNAWKDANCDCGCGKPDPYCRVVNRKSCTEAGCKLATCQYCNNSNNQRAQCDGPTWSTEGTCAPASYGLDGKCDCGCGAIDPDCAQDEGCDDPFCAAKGCEICHGAGSRLATCYTWTCPKEAYEDGKCDCGCGAPDPDCHGLGCSEPGCHGEVDSDTQMEVCKPNGCHDPYGRQVPCP